MKFATLVCVSHPCFGNKKKIFSLLEKQKDEFLFVQRLEEQQQPRYASLMIIAVLTLKPNHKSVRQSFPFPSYFLSMEVSKFVRDSSFV